MKIKVINWNIRGLNEAEKRSTVKALMGKWKPDVLCLQETKIVDWSSSMIQQMWGNRWANWAELKACEFRWCYTGVYGPHTNPDREVLWLELAALRGIWDEQWVIGGDFNGAFYTWSRGEDSIQASRIDRFLFSSEWNDTFKDIKQIALPKVTSDHRPILLENGDWEVGPFYFKFENMWLQEVGFLDKIKEWWQNYSIEGTPDFVLSQKLRCLKKDITDWNRETYGKLETRKSKALDELMAIEQASENRLTTQAEKEKILSLKMELLQIAKAEEVSWRQKSRCLWLKEGDRNTKYFQRVANSCRRNNHIKKLMVGDEIIEDKDQIKSKILDFYQNLYTENEQWRLTATFEDLTCISLEEKEWLEKAFEEDKFFKE
uniref:Endonuclease/exonuclease/phosphatase domain-containing protein n=1 Tax=Nicotiana tabacum TaxID=4097 RepID=A0A1S3XW01_TOBAC|nr:PREDICTED: uncharacterized protein LOC107769198 [Nicotiana tabacum]